jgi:FkbM family methyltransferase
LWFARKYPTATIVAIEPEPGNFAILKQNATLVPNIIALHAAIGCEQGFVEVHNEGFGWAAQTTRASRGVPIVTVATAVQQVDGGSLFIVKVDIEGFESDLFSTNTDWIAETQVIHFEPHDWMLPGRYTSRSAQRAIGQHPFELYIAGENLTYVR